MWSCAALQTGQQGVSDAQLSCEIATLVVGGFETTASGKSAAVLLRFEPAAIAPHTLKAYVQP